MTSIEQLLPEHCSAVRHASSQVVAADCFNTDSFLSPEWFADIGTRYLRRTVRGFCSVGFCVVKHNDGNIMPFLDRLLEMQPHTLHSLDPQGDVDFA